MIKDAVVMKLILISLTAVTFSGCTFIFKDGNTIRYYGIDEKRDIEFLNKILDKQQEIYQAQKERQIILK